MRYFLSGIVVAGMLFGAAAGHANNLEYMVNPKSKDHKVPTAVTEKEKNGEKEVVVTYEDSETTLEALKPASGKDTAKPDYDHYLGH